MKIWLLSILAVSFTLLAILKSTEVQSLRPWFKAERTIKLDSFREARAKVSKEDLDFLELWESILTGRSAPLSKIMKENYKSLGMNHIFTPSGFHLSAVLLPFMKIIKSYKMQLLLLIMIGLGLSFLPGLGALKRMVLIKGHQRILGLHAGFIFALILDIFFGTFQNSTLSFTYSFLFIGIIYSGYTGLRLIIWFFIAQVMLAYFQGTDISPFLLVFSPLLNLIFGFLMPLLFLLSFPLFEWQLQTGVFLLKMVQRLVNFCAQISLSTPSIEIHIITIVIISMIIMRKPRSITLMLLLFSASLNPDRSRAPGSSKYEYSPAGEIRKTVYKEKYVNVYFSDGRCRLRLVRGHWYENCSPKRRSSL